MLSFQSTARSRAAALVALCRSSQLEHVSAHTLCHRAELQLRWDKVEAQTAASRHHAGQLARVNMSHDTELSCETGKETVQARVDRIALEAKKRNPNGYVSSPRASSYVQSPSASVYKPFVTTTGQRILFCNGTYARRSTT